MWIIITGVLLTSPFILFYLINDSSSIVIDKKNCKIIILNISPPAVIKFADLIEVDLMINGTTAKIADIKSKQDLIKRTDSVCLKIITHTDSPFYLYFNNDARNKRNFYSGKKALDFYIKLSELINLPGNSQIKNMTRNHPLKFELKKFSGFRSTISKNLKLPPVNS